MSVENNNPGRTIDENSSYEMQSTPFDDPNDGAQPAAPLLQPEDHSYNRPSEKAARSTAIEEHTPENGVHRKTRQRRKQPNESPSRAFLRSVGLKIVSSTKRLKRRKTDELPKVVESQSLIIAITRLSVHLLPIAITVFLLLFNSIGFLNGPDISGPANFALQVASKLHELTIVGSLTAIAMDTVRSCLLNGGINLGLLSAGQSFASLNWLWSTDFISGFGARMPRRAKIILLFTLILCCIVASVVGPASALLFLPTQLWLPAASTDYYIGGTEDELYPSKLTANNSGPAFCRSSPLRYEDQCLHAGWKTLFAEMGSIGPTRPGWSFLMPGTPARVITGNVPDQRSNYTTALETYAVTITRTISGHMDSLSTANNIAWIYATGRNRRLRDFIGDGGGYAITWAKMPVTRTVCGKLTLVESNITGVHNSSNKLEFPVLSRDEYWRTQNSTGPVQEIDVSTLNLPKEWNGLQRVNISHRQTRAEWVALPSSFGNSTSAGLVFLVQNTSAVYARGCVVDARWADGQNLRKAAGAFFSTEANMGQEPDPSGASFSFTRPLYFDERYKPYYGPSVEITKEWFDDVVLPMPEQTAVGSTFTQNLFEALLNTSRLSEPKWSEDNVDDSRILLEYFATIFLTDAISRIGYDLQTRFPDSRDINPALNSPPITSDLFLNGGPIFNTPSIPHLTAHYATYKYGTAWYLVSEGQWISVAILSLHLLMAICHAIAIMWWKRSSEAWDSTNELVALAYNSRPKEHALENCSSGIERMEPLKKMVRVGTMGDGEKKKVELVFVDEDEEGDGRVVPGEKYI